MAQRKSSFEIVGRSAENLSGASDRVPDFRVNFSPTTLYEPLSSADEPAREPQFKIDLDRQGSIFNKKIDQFEASRCGNLNELEILFNENQPNYKKFFNRLDPETKLTALHFAARFHHLEICRFLVERCQVDVHKQGEDGITPLHYIARFRVEKPEQIVSLDKIVKFLIESGADINARDDSNATPLHHACERDNVRCAEVLLRQDAKIDAVDRQNMTPLHSASFYGSVETARLLIEHGSDLLARDQNESIPFGLACRNSHLEILEMFFKKFENHGKLNEIINATDNEGNNLLHLAVISGNFSIVEILLSKGADPLKKRHDGQTPVHLCTKNDSNEIFEKLIEAGGDLNEVDKEEETVLHKAAAQNRENLVKHILSKQSEKIFVEKKNSLGLSALLLASSFGHSSCVRHLLNSSSNLFEDRDKKERNCVYLASMNNQLETLKILLEKAKENGDDQRLRATVNETDRYNRTGLHAAAESGHVEIVEELLKNGACLTMKDDNEHTPLMLACKKNRLEVLNMLIEHLNRICSTTREKLNILEERDDGSNTALHIAAGEGHASIIKVLLEENCDLQSRNMISWLPIHCAAERGRYNSLRLLVENHSPVDPVDKNQQTPLHLAARNGHGELVKFLLKNGAKIDRRTSTGENCLDLSIAGNQTIVAQILVNHPDWQLILRNASFDEQNDRWETPFRKLIRRMPEIALIVLNKSFKIVSQNKTDQNSKKKSKKQSNIENIVELDEQLHHQTNQIQTAGQIRDQTQRRNFRLIYTYEFLDDQFLLKVWKEGKVTDVFEPEGILYPKMLDRDHDRKALQLNHPIQVMVDNNRENLLDHPVVHSLLDFKWKLYARYVYYFNFLFYVTFVSALTSYVFLSFSPYQFGINFNQMQEMSCFELCSFVKSNQTEQINDSKTRIYAMHIFQWIVIVLSSIQIIKEFFQILSERLDYINLENFVELGAFVLAILFTIDLNSCSREIGYRCVVQWQIGASAVFLSWFALVLFIQKFPRFGIFVVMFTDILRTFSRFFLVFFLFIIGFALAFHMLLQNHNPFGHFGSSLLKTCVMMIGEFEYEGIFHGEETSYFGITYLFFVVFIIVMSIIIMNLLVGLAVDDITSVVRVATIKRLAMRVRLTLDVERQLPFKYFFDSIHQFRTVSFTQSSTEKILKKYFRIQIKNNFDKQFKRAENYGLISGSSIDQQDQKTLKADSTNSNVVSNVATTNNSDWVNSMHSQISTKYNEFNRFMSDLKTQQDRINQILQQFPSAAASRQGSTSNFATIS